MKTRRTMTLPPDVDALLEDLSAGQSSASEYVADLVRTAEREWRTAHRLLVDAGWKPSELLAACDVLNGYHLISEVSGAPVTAIAAELADAQALNNICAKWDIDPARWTEACRRVSRSELEAGALARLAREFWRFNPRVERTIRRAENEPQGGQE